MKLGHDDPTPAGEGTCPGDRCYPELAVEPDCVDLADDVAGVGLNFGQFAKGFGAKKSGLRATNGSAAGLNLGASDVSNENCSEGEINDIPPSISFQCLVASLCRWVMRSKTRFAYFLTRTFHLQCWGTSPSTVVFPLPLADFGVFKSSGPKLCSRRWKCVLRKRILHILVVALNYIYEGGTITNVAMLGRRPNVHQERIHKRLLSLISTCDTPGVFPLSPGRSGEELIARLHHLIGFAKTCPGVACDLYAEGPEDFESKVPRPFENGRDERKRTPTEPDKIGVHLGAVQGSEMHTGFSFQVEKKDPASKVPGEDGSLAPYRPLNADRLRLTGRGAWDLGSHLHDELWLPFVEPAILRHDVPLDGVEGPDFSMEDVSENLRLAKLWSAQGLLVLAPGPPYQDGFSRVFNNLKNEQYDRQIGDRRLMNAKERRCSGPSKYLPGGYLITSIHCPPGYALRGVVTDRKDFYHQAGVSRARAYSNCLPFCYAFDEFGDEKAVQDLLDSLAVGNDREVVGDRYGKSRPPSLLVDAGKAYPCFGSLFQGDHLGVEFALSAHASLLEDHDLLQSKNRILGHHPFPGAHSGRVW